MSRENPWGRLFAEGGVIVASILLALAADAWWDDREDHQLERRYYERIAADLTADSTGLERAMYFNRVVRESALELLSLAEEGGRPTQAPVDIVHAIAWAGFITEGSLSGAFFRIS